MWLKRSASNGEQMTMIQVATRVPSWACACRAAFSALGAGFLLTATASHSTPVSDLPGRWSGFGSITMSSGESEQMRCVATYFVEGAGTSVKQNLRCASQGYKIDATANLTVADGRVSGSWEERTWSTTGSITGRVVASGFQLSIDGPGFTAAMAVDSGACKQSIHITPRGFEVAKITMSLGKC